MTSLEWVQVKKRLSDQENQVIARLKGIGPGPRDRVADEGEQPDYRSIDGIGYVYTQRGQLCREIEEIQARRKAMKPGRPRRW